jgi:two-component system response regulator MprA
MQLLLVEDDPHLAPTLTAALNQQYKVTCVGTVQAARARMRQGMTNLFIIDIGLPDGSGLDLVRQIRSQSAEAGVLILTAEHGVAAKVLALDSGADDYLTKPFSLRELNARLRALVRRSTPERVLHCGVLTLDRAQHMLQGPLQSVQLTKRGFLLMEYLMLHKGMVLTSTQLTELIWGEGTSPVSNALTVYIGRLRRTLEIVAGTHFIHTVPGVGYMLSPGRKEAHGRSDDSSSQ